jgi:hypothetical protein
MSDTIAPTPLSPSADDRGSPDFSGELRTDPNVPPLAVR